MTATYDYFIVGSGIIGLAMAREIALHSPLAKIVVVDKELELGAHASGRNSGVLHAGFYYAPDSLKAQLTRRGNQLLHTFLDDRQVPVRRCGKVVVTTHEDQLPALEMLAERGRANGIELDMLHEDALREVEPLARTVGRALWSPTTSVADPLSVIAAVAADARRLGIELRLGERVLFAKPGKVTTTAGTYSVGHVINAAGLYADRVARGFGMADPYVMLPFKGLYWYSRSATTPLRRHVYPVPDARNPFLGVHATVTVGGRLKIGPTAIPALWRENYRGLAGFSAREAAEVAVGLARLATSEHHDFTGLVRAELPKYLRRVVVDQARRLVPSLDPRDIAVSGKVGIRAQLFDLDAKRLEMDFVVRGDDRSTHLLNSVSPAWTSSLAVAEHTVAGMASRGAI